MKIYRNMFVIHTPYQLLTAINIIICCNIHNVIMVFAHQNMEKYVPIFKDSKIKIILARSFYDKTIEINMFFMHIIIFFRIIKKKILVSKLLNKIEMVDILYIPSDEPSIRVIYNYLLKKNPDLKLKLIDEGIGTYSGIIYKEKSFLSKLAYHLLNVSRVYENIDEIYCYHPELLNISKNVKVHQIYFSNANLNRIGQFFSRQIFEYIGFKVIFLDQGISNFPQIKHILDMLSNYFNKDTILIKKHPRISSCDELYAGYKIINDGLPFEILLSSLDFSKCLIVTFSSSAAANPYLILNERPFVLLLHKLCVRHNKGEGDAYFKEINLGQVESFFNKINKKIGYEYIYQPENMKQCKIFFDAIKQFVSAISVHQMKEESSYE